MSIPASRPPPPALPVALVVAAVAHAAMMVAFAVFRTAPELRTSAGKPSWSLIMLGGRAVACASVVVGAAAALSLVRSRRSAGGALAAAAYLTATVALVTELVVTHLWPPWEAYDGWRGDVITVVMWVLSATTIAIAVGLCAAGWADRGVRLLAPGAIGASFIVGAPPILVERAFGWVERDTWRWSNEAGDYIQVPDARMWIVPGVLAAASLAWGVSLAVIASRQPPVPVDTVTPRPPAPALRRLAITLLAMAAVAIVAGIVISQVQGKPASGTGPLSRAIPIAVGLAAAAVAAALVDIAVRDVAPHAARFAAFAAICVFWCVAVIAAQTIGSQRPHESGPMNPLLFSIFDPPWMPGMVGAVVAVLALLAIAAMLAAVARQAGQRMGRAQALVIVLALAIGALTTPWVLGFGTRSLPMDSLRIATLVSAAVVNLAAWIALARSAWRTALALDGSVIASPP